MSPLHEMTGVKGKLLTLIKDCMQLCRHCRKKPSGQCVFEHNRRGGCCAIWGLCWFNWVTDSLCINSPIIHLLKVMYSMIFVTNAFSSTVNLLLMASGRVCGSWCWRSKVLSWKFSLVTKWGLYFMCCGGVTEVLERSHQVHICLHSLIFHLLIMFCCAKWFHVEFFFVCLFIFNMSVVLSSWTFDSFLTIEK